MGLVYKGRHESLGRDAAIKTLLPKDVGDPVLRQRLLGEARAQARLRHSNIVTVYDLIDDQGELFIAMEYVDGETLAALLDRRPRGRMALDEALPLFEQVLAALEWVHGEKIVHRDVKPSNVMVCGSDVKLTDFGIALLGETSRITASRQLLGSPPYMSPDQLEGKDVDSSSDIYSAALVVYRMLAGRPPFVAKEYYAQVQERVVGPPDLRTLIPELPAGVCDAITIALRHDREQRFRSIAAFRAALRDGAAGFLVSAPQSIEHDREAAVAPDATTELLPMAPEPEARNAIGIVAIVIAGTFVAATSVLRSQWSRQSFPAKAPPQNRPVITGIALPVVLEPAAVPIAQPKREPEKGEPRKGDPFPVPKSEPVEDEETRRLRELETLRDAIRHGLTHAEEDLGGGRFDGAIEELDRVGEMAQRDPGGLSRERAQIAQLRSRVVEARVAAETRKADDAQWASRLVGIEEDLRAARWPEAERFAGGIANDPRAPEPIAARARALLQQAKDGRKSAFDDMQLGPTSNTIRKPSSPPRKDL
jgi:serine/threonine protein kinase